MNSEELMKEVMQTVQEFDIGDMPNIELYMDQVTTYLNEKLKIAKRNDEDKLLTKTMINNYAKSHLLPPPVRKKYSKDHLLSLILIFFFKNVISINDVTTILNPLLGEYFQNDETKLSAIFENFLEYIRTNDNAQSILEEYKTSLNLMSDIETEDRDRLQTLTLISILCYDMFVRKLMVEKLVDSLPKQDTPQTKSERKNQVSKDKNTKKDSKKKTDTPKK